MHLLVYGGCGKGRTRNIFSLSQEGPEFFCKGDQYFYHIQRRDQIFFLKLKGGLSVFIWGRGLAQKWGTRIIVILSQEPEEGPEFFCKGDQYFSKLPKVSDKIDPSQIDGHKNHS